MPASASQALLRSLHARAGGSTTGLVPITAAAPLPAVGATAAAATNPPSAALAQLEVCDPAPASTSAASAPIDIPAAAGREHAAAMVASIVDVSVTPQSVASSQPPASAPSASVSSPPASTIVAAGWDEEQQLRKRLVTVQQQNSYLEELNRDLQAKVAAKADAVAAAERREEELRRQIAAANDKYVHLDLAHQQSLADLRHQQEVHRQQIQVRPP